MCTAGILTTDGALLWSTHTCVVAAHWGDRGVGVEGAEVCLVSSICVVVGEGNTVCVLIAESLACDRIHHICYVLGDQTLVPGSHGVAPGQGVCLGGGEPGKEEYAGEVQHGYCVCVLGPLSSPYLII